MLKTIAFAGALLCFVGCAAMAENPGQAKVPEASPPVTDFTVVLKDIDGKPLTYIECAKPDDKNPMNCAVGAIVIKDLTLEHVTIEALKMPEQNESGTDQIRRTLLAEDIYKHGQVALTGKDVELLDTVIPKWVAGQKMSTVITLRATQIIDPALLKKQ